ncbi:MAG: hypothetical protein IT456_10680 [Planctomycetes bacterium]|nr:hypothetical protein [Planctomycetota bacterium]
MNAMLPRLITALAVFAALPAQAPALVRDIQSGAIGSQPSEFCELRAGITCFGADDGVNGRELWITDGSAAGTTLVRDIQPGPQNSTPHWLERLGNRVYFAATDNSGPGTELFATDGTTAGTVMGKDINAFNRSTPAWLTRVGGRIYFTATDDNFDNELWCTDGTAAGTVRVIDLDPAGSSQPADLCELGYSGVFVFTANVGGDRELWRSDGTAAGTWLVRNIHPTSTSFPGALTRCGDKVVFQATDGTNGAELWITDGTTAGTVILLDIMPGLFDSSPYSFSASDDGRCVFTCNDWFTFGQELWVTDGTPAGTMMAVDLEPGMGSLLPSHLTWAGNRDVYLRGTDGVNGSELWRVRGLAAAGTTMVTELQPGIASSDPQATSHGRETFQDSFGRLYLAADDGVTGSELRMIPLGAWSKSVDRPCGVGANRPELAASPPVIGSTCTFTSAHAPAGTWTALLLHLGAPSPVDLGDGCRNHMNGGALVAAGWIATPGPTWTLAVPVPAAPALAGLQMAAQTVYSAAFVTIDGWSNGVWLQLGF